MPLKSAGAPVRVRYRTSVRRSPESLLRTQLLSAENCNIAVAPVTYAGESYRFKRDCWGWYLPVDYVDGEPPAFPPLCFGSEGSSSLVLSSVEYLFSLNGTRRNTGIFEKWDGNWPLFYGLLKQQPNDACGLLGCVGQDLAHHYHLLCWGDCFEFDVASAYDEIRRRQLIATKLRPEWAIG